MKYVDCMNDLNFFLLLFNYGKSNGIMENILLGDVYFIKYIFRLADKHMLSKVMLKYVIKVSKNLQGRDVTALWTLKKWATHRYKLQQNRVVFLSFLLSTSKQTG